MLRLKWLIQKNQYKDKKVEKTWEELPKFFTPSLKKRVVHDWHHHFNKWKIDGLGFEFLVGPLNISFSFKISLSKSYYQPHFSVHNLSRSFEFLFATLSMEDPKFFLKLQWHDKNYRQAVEDLKARLPLPWKPPISLDQVIEAYQKTVGERYWNILVELEDPIMLSTWAGAQDRAETCLEWSWDYLKKNRDPLRGGSLLEWRRRMEAIMDDPNSLRQTARTEVIKHKLTKNPSCCFSDTPYQECLTKIPFD